MEEIQYFAPSSLHDCVAFLNQHPEATPMAGGTDLLVRLRRKKDCFKILVDLKNIPELNFIRVEGENVIIGAATLISDLEKNSIICSKYPFLAKAASQLGSWQIRNIATVGGNLCNASPSAELAPPLLALDAKVIVTGFGGERTLSLQEFFRGPGETALKKGELLKEISVPGITEKIEGVYLRHTLRRSMDIALVSAAVLLKMDDQAINYARVCLGAVAPVPMRAIKTEEFLKGKNLSEAFINEAAQIAAEEAKPISDLRSSAFYRKEMVKVYVRRCLLFLRQKEEIDEANN